jgi:hypothetical protein
MPKKKTDAILKIEEGEKALHATVFCYCGLYLLVMTDDVNRVYIADCIDEFVTHFTGLTLCGATIFYVERPDWFIENIIKPCLIYLQGKLKEIRLDSTL